MRKLRRLPWRIPNPHTQQPASSASGEFAPRPEPEKPEQEARREVMNTQPVAFSGGRYVYGMAPSVPCSTEIRRKAKHRTVLPLTVAAAS